MWLAYAKIPITRFSLYREAIMIIVAGLCEDTHPPASLYIEEPIPRFSLYRKALVAGLCEDIHPPASLYIGKH